MKILHNQVLRSQEYGLAAGADQEDVVKLLKNLKARLMDDADHRHTQRGDGLECECNLERGCGVQTTGWLICEQRQRNRRQFDSNIDTLPLATAYTAGGFIADARISNMAQATKDRSLSCFTTDLHFFFCG
jgi:hypothetical protein